MVPKDVSINFNNLVKINLTRVVRDLPRLNKPDNNVCKECQVGKQTKGTFRGKEQSSTTLLDLVHIDLCGLIRTRSLQGERHFMLLIDDHSRMTWVTFLREKSKVLEKCKIFKTRVKNEVDIRIKCLTFDIGGEFISNEIDTFYEKYEIRRHLYALRIPR